MTKKASLVVLVVSVLPAACGSRSGLPPGAQGLAFRAAAAPTSVPLVPNIGDKPGYHVQLSIAGTKAKGFLFDTGSTGLWVYANTIAHPKKPVHDLQIKADNEYGSGLYYEGEAVKTTVSFGSGFPSETLPLVRVTKAYCVTNSCEKNYGKGDVIGRLEKERGLWGTFGADLEPRPISEGTHQADLYNILFGLGNAWTSFVVEPFEIQAAPRMKDFTTIAMRLGPTTYKPLPNGAKSWMRDVKLCYQIGDPKIYSKCLPTLFDTGASGISFRSNAGAKLPPQGTTYCGTVLEAGTLFSAVAKRRNGKLLAHFVAGPTQNWNEVHIATPKPSESPEVNTGLTFYNRKQIAFDAVHGLIGLRPLRPPIHQFEKDCN
jgi:hypothetical protein